MADDIEPSSPPVARPFLEFRPLLRAVGIACDARKLILATAGLLVLQAGWWAVAGAFGNYAPWFTSLSFGPSIIDGYGVSVDTLREAARLMSEPFRTIVLPFVSLFTRGAGLSLWFQSALMAAWAVVVWGIMGGAIARIAVVQAASGQRVGLGTAVRFALGKSASLIGAPLTPLLAVGFFATGCGLFGLLYRIPGGFGGWIASIFGFVPLLFGLVMALILLGLAIGWPLMHATVAAEGEDAPDALSRSYSYVNQRLTRYIVHAVVSLAIGSIGLVVMILFARVVLGLADWGVSLGAPALVRLNELESSGRLFWAKVVGLLVHGWAYSYFWSAISIIYLILRRDVDGTPWHDVYLPEHAADTFAGEPSKDVLEGAPTKSVVLTESAPAETSVL